LVSRQVGNDTDVLTFFFFSSRRRHTRFSRDWSSDVCSSDLRIPFRSRGALIDGRQLLAPFLVLMKASGSRFARFSARFSFSESRSEERRVGKECRSRRTTAEHAKRSKNKSGNDSTRELAIEH